MTPLRTRTDAAPNRRLPIIGDALRHGPTPRLGERTITLRGSATGAKPGQSQGVEFSLRRCQAVADGPLGIRLSSQAPPTEGETHCWLFKLDPWQSHIPSLRRLLRPAEWDRATSFSLASARDSYTIRRAITRLILAGYLHADAFEVPISEAPSGKPELPSAKGIHFNLARTTHLAVLAVAAGPTGIDLEPEHRSIGPLPLPTQILHPSEPPCGPRSLLLRWVRKEAALKAAGLGLSVSMSHVRLTDACGGVAVVPAPSTPSLWHLIDLPTQPGYFCALAAADPPRAVRIIELFPGP